MGAFKKKDNRKYISETEPNKIWAKPDESGRHITILNISMIIWSVTMTITLLYVGFFLEIEAKYSLHLMLGTVIIGIFGNLWLNQKSREWRLISSEYICEINQDIEKSFQLANNEVYKRKPTRQKPILSIVKNHKT
jgi:hypothetical protein